MGGRTPHDVCRAETRQAIVVGLDGDWPRFTMGEATFAQQIRQRSHQILRNGNDTISAPLAVKQHLRAPSLQLNVVRVDTGRFGYAGAGSRQEEQKGPVTPAARRCLIRGCDDGLHLGGGQVARHCDVGPFGGDRQNSLGDAEGGGIGGGDVMEEGPDRGKPGVARCDGVVPLLLELVEKGENEVPIEILKGQRRRLLPQTGRGKEDQHAQGVAIAGQGRGGGVTLLGQARAFCVHRAMSLIDEAVAWVKRCPNPMPVPSEIEIRPI